MTRPARQPEKPLHPDILRLVEGIALSLAQEHHALKIAGKGLGGDDDVRSDKRQNSGSEDDVRSLS
jgi:hypothetical protein